MAICRNCNAQMPDGVAFCTRCGTKFDNQTYNPVSPTDNQQLADTYIQERKPGIGLRIMQYIFAILAIVGITATVYCLFAYNNPVESGGVHDSYDGNKSVSYYFNDSCNLFHGYATHYFTNSDTVIYGSDTQNLIWEVKDEARSEYEARCGTVAIISGGAALLFIFLETMTLLAIRRRQ